MDLGLDLEPLVRVASEPIRKFITAFFGQNEDFLVGKGGKIRRYRRHDTLKNSIFYLAFAVAIKCEYEERKGDVRRVVNFWKMSRWGGGRCGGLYDGVSIVCVYAPARRLTVQSQFLREMLQFSPTRPTPVRLHIPTAVQK